VGVGSGFTAGAVVVNVSVFGDVVSAAGSLAPPLHAPTTTAIATNTRNLRMVGLRGSGAVVGW